MKVGEELPCNSAVLQRDGYRCVACAFALRFALTVHHDVPRALGGLPKTSNLTTLCPNCHRIVHWLSVGRRLEGRSADDVKRVVRPKVFQTLHRLARRIRYRSQRTRLADNQWVEIKGKAQGPIPLRKALNLISVRNELEAREAVLMRRVVRRVVRSIPRKVRRACAFRLVRQGRYLSVNAGNHLLFRTPAYLDDGKRQDADLFLIWPRDTRMSCIPHRDWHRAVAFRFAAVPCFNIALGFEQALSLRPDEWHVFGRACQEALRPGTRRWVSNVSVP